MREARSLPLSEPANIFSLFTGGKCIDLEHEDGSRRWESPGGWPLEYRPAEISEFCLGTPDAEQCRRYAKKCEEFAAVVRAARAAERHATKAARAGQNTCSNVKQLGENAFRRDGKFWLIKYDGEEAFRLNDLVGLHYLHELIANLGHQYTARELCAIRNRGRGPAAVVANQDNRQEEQDDLAVGETNNEFHDDENDEDQNSAVQDEEVRRNATAESAASRVGNAHGGLHELGAGDEQLDKRGRTALRRQIKKLDEEIEAAEKSGMVQRAEELREAREPLSRYLSSAMGLAGRARRLQDPAKKAADSVRAAIDRALQEIGEECPKLAHHLTNSLRRAETLSYAPEDDPDWQT